MGNRTWVKDIQCQGQPTLGQLWTEGLGPLAEGLEILCSHEQTT
jgi:hypothetical protein